MAQATSSTPQIAAPTTANITSPKEIKMNTPTPFSGERKKLDTFLMEVEMYLAMNNDIYDTDKKKIIFTLSFMKDGTAGAWKQSYWTTHANAAQIQSWDDFKQEIRDSFTQVDKEGDAITKLETETMSGGTADEYIEKFKIWAVDSGVTQDRPLIEWFMKGMNGPLLDKILGLENPPTTIKGWCDTASKLDNQWRRGRAIASRLRGNPQKKGLKLPNPRFKYTTPDPNAMDVDRLTLEERNEHMKRGLCFKCHQFGHRSNECGMTTPQRTNPTPGPSRPLPPRPIYKKADDAYAHIKMVYQELPDEEKKKLFGCLEESGF
jgi:hypothetical protein